MKIAGFILSLLVSATCMAQMPLLESKVYSWEGSKADIKGSSGEEKLIFNGKSGKLSPHSMRGIMLHKGKKLNYLPDNDGPERFFIIKKGPVSVQLLGASYTIDRGSVIVLLPGDVLTILNKNNTDAELYEMSYHSIAAADAERGRKAGTSFVMNWNDMVFKPHDKGGVRQLFDRPTTMLNRFDIHVTQLNSGFKSHDPHTHANEEIILMLEGNAEMQIGNQHQKANPGDVVLLNSMVLHNLTNIGTTPCLYFAIQWN